MSKARNLADLLDANGDVALSNLDNVPPSNDASALTTGTLSADRIAAGSIGAAKLANSAKTVRSATAPSNPSDGDIWYDTADKEMKYYNGTASQFVPINYVKPSITSVTGNLWSGATPTITLTGENFPSSEVTVNFAGGATDSDVSVTPTNDTTISVTVPSNITSLSSGTAVTIKVRDSLGVESAGFTGKSVVAYPTGGTVTTSGSDRIHTFTSSGTFTVSTGLTLTDVDFLIVAGGGGGGADDGGGGGGGGLRTSYGSVSGKRSSPETPLSMSAGSYTVTVGAGGSGSQDGGSRPANASGGNSSISGSGITTITSLGGGGAGTTPDNDQRHGLDGGCGGGACQANGVGIGAYGGSGTEGQGYGGGNGSEVTGSAYVEAGGGGGTDGGGADGNSAGNASNGGAGTYNSISGSSTPYGGGGGGASRLRNQPSGGTGGGGNGAYINVSNNTNGAGAPGTNNLGGGGGGGQGTTNAGLVRHGGNGGSGIVIIRYTV